MTEKARIKLPESFRQPGTPEGVLFRGTGTNLKTGKEISFSVPDTISKKGLEGLAKNVRLPLHHEALVYDLQELFE
ncbi:MAG TPA: hypothetical protein VLD37_05565 [Candidatus Bilamarchaeum sp.]|nr:hypothetical protein [Candidatus Bilamarchaeum sp.]